MPLMPEVIDPKVCATPLGPPVVPEVYMMSASASLFVGRSSGVFDRPPSFTTSSQARSVTPSESNPSGRSSR
ncbi:hypothetical protein ABL78_8298 [Leptomonas seymouri]|uniref:Uncharacterized protein n=1 Tax=Leptomonas seymouri TaxID=5684 RepID=A0A0N0P294_LEPSE|nr:hypothetical protein ABL78_8298 [Leptomonas seymouri]|eukprot:KPI82689.1 hypothetical protein ABL78_8298 [Leptomonas seymouri]